MMHDASIIDHRSSIIDHRSSIIAFILLSVLGSHYFSSSIVASLDHCVTRVAD
jgi:hypothetical protein